MIRLDVLLSEAALYLLPLVAATKDEDALRNFFLGFGHDINGEELGRASSAISGVRNSIDSFYGSFSNGNDETARLGSFRSAFDAFRGLSQQQELGSIISDLDAWFLEVFDLLTYHYVSTRQFLLSATLQALGVMVREEVKTTDPGGRDFDYVRTRIDWSRLIDFVIDTKKWARDVYGWGSDPSANPPEGFDYEAAIESIAHLVEASGLALAHHRPMDASDVAQYLLNSSGVTVSEFAVPILQDGFNSVDSDGATVFSTEAGIKIVPFGDLNQPRNLGLALKPYAQGDIEDEQNITSDLKLTIQGNASGAGGMMIVIQPSGLDVRGTASAGLTLELKLSYGRRDQSSIILLGAENATRLQSQVLHTDLRVTPSQFELEAGADGSKIIISRSDGDGFLNKVLPEQALEIPFDLGVGWSNTKGLYFRGGATLEVSIPIHQDLFGVLKIDTVDLALAAAGGSGREPKIQLSQFEAGAAGGQRREAGDQRNLRLPGKWRQPRAC